MGIKDLQSPINLIEGLLKSNTSIFAYQLFEKSQYWYDTFVEEPIPGPSLFFNTPWNIYCCAYGPRNAQGIKQWPVKRKPDQTLDGFQPLYYYTTIQLPTYVFITEILNERQFRVYSNQLALLPLPPFYLYYIVLNEFNDELTIPRIKEKLKIIANEDGVFTTETNHILEVTNETNFPMLGFYRTNIDDFIPSSFSELPDDDEMKIPLVSRWDQWAIRPLSHHQITPFRAFTYTCIPVESWGERWNWLFPIPYAELVFDDKLVETPLIDPIQYGYDTPQELLTITFWYNGNTNLYNLGSTRVVAVAKSFTYLPAIPYGFGHSRRKQYFKMSPEVKYKAAVTIWTN